MPGYFRGWLGGNLNAAERKTKIGADVWKPFRERDDSAIVMIRLRDFEELHGRIGDSRDPRRWPVLRRAPAP